MIIQTPEQLKQFLADFNYKCFSFDTETDILDWHTQKIEGVSLYDGKNAAYMAFDWENTDEMVGFWFHIRKKLKQLFEQAEIIIGHNLVYDFKVLMKLFGREFTNSVLKKVTLIDTMLAIYVLNPEKPRGLKDNIELYFPGETRKRWKDVQHLDRKSKEFAKYGMQDAVDTWNLLEVLKPKLKEFEAEQVFRIECDFIPVQIEVETTGVPLDQELMKEQETQLEIAKCDLEERMIDALGLQKQRQGNFYAESELLMPLNFLSPKAVADFIQKKMGIELQVKTEKGAYSVGKKTIEQLLDRHPFFPLYQKYRAVMKLLTGFVRPFWDLMRNGKIYPNLRNVKSGRSVAYNRNLYQLALVNKLVPEINIRKLFIPRPGNGFIKCDYDQQELRILAHITQDRNLIAAFRQGKDVHLDTANKVFNLGIPEQALIKTSDLYRQYRKKFEWERTDIKPTNFGIPYGKHTEYNQQWFRTYPQVAESIKKVKGFVREKGYSVTWAGRRRYYKTFRATDLRSGFNMVIQGTGADMAKKAAGELWRHLQDVCPEARFLLLPYDEFLLEAPKERLQDLLTPMKEYMENTMKLSVPLVAEPKIVESYGD